MATRFEGAPLLATRAAARVDTQALAARVTLSALTFFVVYTVIHTAHTLHHDLPALSRVSGIPLFSCCIASAVVAAAGALFAGPVLRARPALQAHLPRLLALCVLVFTLMIVLIP